MARTFQYDSKPCTRCGGTGHYSFCTAFGTTCFQCGGRKVALTKKGAAASAAVAKLMADFGYGARTKKGAYEMLAGRLTAGQRALPYGGGAWRAVAAVDIDTAHPCVWSGNERAACAWRMVVRFTDGSSADTSTSSVWFVQAAPEHIAARTALLESFIGNGVTVTETA